MPVHFFVLSTVMKLIKMKRRTEITISTSAQRGASIYSLPSFKGLMPMIALFAWGLRPIHMYPRTTAVIVTTVAQNWSLASGRFQISVSDSSDTT